MIIMIFTIDGDDHYDSDESVDDYHDSDDRIDDHYNSNDRR